MANQKLSRGKQAEEPQPEPIMVPRGVQSLVYFENKCVEIGLPFVRDLYCRIPGQDERVSFLTADRSAVRYGPMEIFAKFNVAGALEFSVGALWTKFADAKEQNLIEFAELLGDEGQELLISIVKTKYDGFEGMIAKLRELFVLA